MPADDIFKSLNKAQCRAVGSKSSTVAILAGPGSGKTHTLTSRVAWLVDGLGYQPCNIIVSTFTVKAAREMKERIGKCLGQDREKKIVLGTFHSIARRYLSTYGKRIGLDQKFGIADDADSRSIITRICKRLDVQIDPPLARAWISKKKAKGSSASEVNPKAKDSKPAESRALETCYTEYQQHLERSNLLDYDDLLVRCVELLTNHPSCVTNVQAVLVDEYQDTNGIQYELTKLFAQHNWRITIVGDPDQSIYGWRSADTGNLRRFLRDFPGTDEVSLEENYRSSSSILSVSLNVIEQEKERYNKALLPIHGEGLRPVLRRLRNPPAEAEWIVSEIRRMQIVSGDMLTSNDVAILLRSAALSRFVESALGKAGMAYKMVGGFKFYDRAEIKILLDYLRTIDQPHNNDALARIMNVPKRGIGPGTILPLLEEAERTGISLWTLLTKHCRGERNSKAGIRKQVEQKINISLLGPLNRMTNKFRNSSAEMPFTLVELIEQLLQELNFKKYLEEAYTAEPESRWANVQEFISLAGEFMRDYDRAAEEMLPEIEGEEQTRETDVLTRFLANISLASEKQTDQDQDGKATVTVSTIHAAKGLEWPIVFIPAVYEGSIPHSRSEDMDEERRLLYVAMTRAKALLYLSCPQRPPEGAGSSSELTLSPFIANLGSSHFLKKGPSPERRNMEAVARIIGRTLPPDSVIYKDIPPMTALDDNTFPTDPNQPKHSETSLDLSTHESRQYKRQKSLPTRSSANIVPESVEGWNTPYSTTMDNGSSFTVPTFTTAGAHLAANPVPPPHLPSKSSAPSTRKMASNRPPSQRSLVGYMVEKHDNSDATKMSEAPTISTHQSAEHAQPPAHASEKIPNNLSRKVPAPIPKLTVKPDLPTHKLGSGRLTSKPPPMKRYDTVPAKAYANFSSSPVRPTADADHSMIPEPPTEEQVRPASCFHATTISAPETSRGFQRPASLKRSGIAPVDRLKKPFRPLTIKRQ